MRKQRDLILAQRKKQREADAAVYEKQPLPARAAPAAPAPPAPVVPVQPQATGLRRAAGYSEQKDDLSRALATSMKASLIGGDSAVLGHEQTILQVTDACGCPSDNLQQRFILQTRREPAVKTVSECQGEQRVVWVAV